MATPAATPQPAGAVSEEQRAKEEALVNKATAIKALWKSLSTAYTFPQELPPRNKCHRDFMLQEAAWLAFDFMQERLWRRSAAYQLAQAAVQFDRKQLRPTKTRVCVSVEKAPEEFGKVKPDKADAKASKAAAAAAERYAAHHPSDDPIANGVPPIRLSAPCFLVTPGFAPLLLAQLEEEDVQRLTKHVEAQQRYVAVYEEARRAHPAVLTPEEEDLLPGRRKARKLKLEVDEQGLDYTISPSGGRARPRPGAGPGAGMMEVDGGRDKRNQKRKNRDYDEDYELPAKVARDRLGARPPLGPQMARPGQMDVPGMGMGKPVPNRAMNNKTPTKVPGQAQRQDSMGRMGSMRPGMFQRPGVWTPQDDQVLVAFVQEFNQNWFLVADVMRTASAMSGVSRRPDTCKSRFIQLQRASQGIPEHEEIRPEHLQHQLISKPHAKDILQQALPVSDSVLATHRQILVEVVNKLQQRRMADRQQSREANKMRATDHASFMALQQSILAQNGGRVLQPCEIGIVQDPGAQPVVGGQMGGLPGEHGGGGMGQGQGRPGQPPGAGQGMSQTDAAAAQAAAQANAAAQAAAAAVTQQQQQQGMGGGQQPGGGMNPGGGGGSGTGLKLPPGMTKEQLLHLAQTTPIATLQQQYQAAKQVHQSNPTQQSQIALQTAQTVLTAAQTLYARQQQKAQAAAAAQAAGQSPGVGGMHQGGGGGVPGQSGPAAGGRPQPNPNQLVTVVQVQQLIASNRVSQQMGQLFLSHAQKGTLTYGQVQQVMQQAKAQAQQAAAQAAAMGPQGGMPGGLMQQGRMSSGNMPLHPSQLQGMQGPGPGVGGMPGQPGPGGMPGMHPYAAQQQHVMQQPRQQ